MSLYPYDRHLVKIFGASVDASDDPWTLQLKHAAMDAQTNGVSIVYSDPYDAMVSELAASNLAVEAGGKFCVPTWLQPIPQPSDRSMITREAMAEYVTNRGMQALSDQVGAFVRSEIFPSTPMMIGVDHSVSGGTITALSEELGPENLSVIICDQHFDGLPLSLRLDSQSAQAVATNNDMPTISLSQEQEEEYCCGNFIQHLVDSGTILLPNLFLIGVADYPDEQCSPAWMKFKENYIDYERRGCHFFPQSEFNGSYYRKLEHFITDHVSTPYVYVSLDMDVGAYRCVHAARYMDTLGITKTELLDVADIIAKGCRERKYRLAGLDAMEFNVHFLNLEFEPGKQDDTISVALDFCNTLLSTL